jgi:subtilase family serine protease
VTSYQSETSLSGSNGGYSEYFTRPSYQTGIHSNAYRGVPDLSANADPNSGYAICYTVSSFDCFLIGGKEFKKKNLDILLVYSIFTRILKVHRQ